MQGRMTRIRWIEYRDGGHDMAEKALAAAAEFFHPVSFERTIFGGCDQGAMGGTNAHPNTLHVMSGQYSPSEWESDRLSGSSIALSAAAKLHIELIEFRRPRPVSEKLDR